MTHHRIGSLIAVRRDGGAEEVTGMVTARDVLRALGRAGSTPDAEGELGPVSINEIAKLEKELTVKSIFTPGSKIVYCSPDDTLLECANLMVEMRYRSLPVLEPGGGVCGFVTLKDIWALHHERERLSGGGKDNYMRHVLPRRGMPAGTVVPDRSTRKALHMSCACAYLPNPKKYARDDEAAAEHGEDAHFVLQRKLLVDAPHGFGGIPGDVTVVGVADGVGEWAARGVNAREFAQLLMRAAAEHVTALSETDPVPSPLDILHSAWATTQEERVTGSSTAVVVLMDPHLRQLRAASLGDSGLLILRDAARKTSGSLAAPATTGVGGRQVVFRSQQQLHSFNYPFQLGWASDREDAFDVPTDAEQIRVHVEPHDIVIIASDGLFDNVHEADLIQQVNDWLAEESQPGAKESLQRLADTLVRLARERSLDKMTDSPFAVLAKDNDIMWGGGMPDDTTVVVGMIGEA